ncbi:MAG TPA: hypothetical protein V6D43_14050 [Candidatus Sericytochromatia bacterium]
MESFDSQCALDSWRALGRWWRDGRGFTPSGFHFNPFPSVKELKALAKVVETEAQRLRKCCQPKEWG